MYSAVHEYVVDRINKSVIESFPYPYIIIDNIFPDNLYKLLLKNSISNTSLLNLKAMKRVGSGYSDSRSVLNLEPHMPKLDNGIKDFWENFAKYMHYHFQSMIMKKFKLSMKNSKGDLLYTRDTKNYSLGPHTDKITKLLTCLIYLPADNTNVNLGTSIYTPKDDNFRCIGGPHHKHENFNLYKTVDYIPNRMFCFLKTDKSFHGVEPIDIEVERNLLIFDIQKNEV